jgi:para-aminobenzoate synthetase component 1
MSKPIKGTSKSLKFLQESEKDKAENLMITDMMRNDIGKIAQIGSIKVSELFKITKYKTLYQMHSTVEGNTESSLIEIIKATFPPASVTGAPKRKAVEIIDTLEPYFRSYYCGCAGLVKSETDFTLSVLIRTAIGMRDKLSYYAGCGIVWDSKPKKELNELYLKVKAFYLMQKTFNY